MWDIRPFVADGGKRHCETFVGATHNVEKGLLNCGWSADGSMVTGGNADKVVHIWDELTFGRVVLPAGAQGACQYSDIMLSKGKCCCIWFI